MRPDTFHLFGPAAVTAGDGYALDVQVGGVFFTGEDLDDWTFSASLRRRPGVFDSFGEFVEPDAEFSVDVVADELGSATVTLTLAADDTAALGAGRWVWDLQAVDPDDVPHTLLRGLVTVLGQVTSGVGGT